MAGTEQKGVDSGFESLLDNAKWIITPTFKNSNLNAFNTLSKLITSMECEILKHPQKNMMKQFL